MCENKDKCAECKSEQKEAPAIFKDGKCDVKELLFALSRMTAVSGNEKTANKALIDLCGAQFDETLTDVVGNVIFIKKCGRAGAPKLLIDGHMDEVGLVVSNISDDGFLTVSSLGGADARTFAASDVTIHGDKPVYGVFCATPPHLFKGDRRAMPPLHEMRIDTGYTKDVLASFGVRIGTIVTQNSEPFSMLNDYVTGKAFDDRISVACAVAAIAETDKADLAADIYITASINEETGGAGPARYAFDIRPEYALIVDVSFDVQPGASSDTTKSGGGPVFEVSTVTDRALTDDVIESAKFYKIPYKTTISPSYTGTNSEDVTLTAEGVATVVLGTPIRNMHTSVETVRMCDVNSLRDIIAAVAKSGRIASQFAHEGYTPPMKPVF